MENSKEKAFYSNKVNIAGSMYDLTLTFAQQFGETETDEQKVIVMSPQHAKVLCKILSDSVKQYEETFGKTDIKVPIDKK